MKWRTWRRWRSTGVVDGYLPAFGILHTTPPHPPPPHYYHIWWRRLCTLQGKKKKALAWTVKAYALLWLPVMPLARLRCTLVLTFCAGTWDSPRWWPAYSHGWRATFPLWRGGVAVPVAAAMAIPCNTFTLLPLRSEFYPPLPLPFPTLWPYCCYVLVWTLYSHFIYLLFWNKITFWYLVYTYCVLCHLILPCYCHSLYLQFCPHIAHFVMIYHSVVVVTTLCVNLLLHIFLPH